MESNKRVGKKTENRTNSTESSEWYSAGLRFKCRGCGGCCTGEPGYVWVTDEEIERISKAVGLPRYQFENSFVRLVAGKKKSLIELPGGDCVLFDPQTRGCRVYADRPVQCRTWPFWNQNIDRPSSWQKTAKFCRGCNNPEGKLYTEKEIKLLRDEKF